MGTQHSSWLPCIFRSPGGEVPPDPQLGPFSMLSQQSDSIRAHMEGERSEGRGWLKQVQARWLGLAIQRDLEPLCVGLCPCLERKHMHVHTYTCSVGLPVTHAEVFSMCHSGNLEQVNPAIPALHLEYHRQPCLNSRFIYLFFSGSIKKWAASFLPEL